MHILTRWLGALSLEPENYLPEVEEPLYEGVDSSIEEDVEKQNNQELYHAASSTLLFTHPLLIRAFNTYMMPKKMLYTKVISSILLIVNAVELLSQRNGFLGLSIIMKLILSIFCAVVLALSCSLQTCQYVQTKYKHINTILYGCSCLNLGIIMLEVVTFEPSNIIPEYLVIPFAISILMPFFGGVTAHVNFIVIGVSQSFLTLCSFALLNTLTSCSGMGHGSPLLFSSFLVLVNGASLLIAYSLMCSNIQLFVVYQKYRRLQRDSVSKKAEELKTSYIAQTLHDIGTPMNTLTLGLDLLKQSELSDDQHEIIETCECSVEMMCLTRRKAMDYAKYRENETLRPRLTRVNLKDLLMNKCKRIMSGFNDGGGVDMQFVLYEGVADFIISDRDWLWEMLSNFLSNAKKFTYAGHIITEVRLSANQQELIFEVRDTGIGIPGKRKNALFRPFSQLQRGAGGTGLGLYGVKVKSGLLGGYCGVKDNAIDKVGTVFWFSIPYKPDLSERDMEVESMLLQSTSLCTPRAPPRTKILHPPRKQWCNENAAPEFLYVEDQLVLRKMVKASLQKIGVKVHLANDGKQALDMLKERLYSLALLDLGLPKLSGTEVLQELRLWEEKMNRERQPAAIVSGTVVQAEVDEALAAGADFFLPKPITAEQIMKVYLEVQRRRQEITLLETEQVTAKKNVFVLIIEDENSTRKFLVKILEKLGYVVKTARDGAEGLAKLKEQQYFVVFCDLNMPVMDGFECIQRFRRWEQDRISGNRKTTTGDDVGVAPCSSPDHAAGGRDEWNALIGLPLRERRQVVYALSAAATDIDKDQALKVGMDDFLEKPIKITCLQKALEKLEQSRNWVS